MLCRMVVVGLCGFGLRWALAQNGCPRHGCMLTLTLLPRRQERRTTGEDGGSCLIWGRCRMRHLWSRSSSGWMLMKIALLSGGNQPVR